MESILLIYYLKCEASNNNNSSRLVLGGRWQQTEASPIMEPPLNEPDEGWQGSLYSQHAALMIEPSFYKWGPGSKREPPLLNYSCMGLSFSNKKAGVRIRNEVLLLLGRKTSGSWGERKSCIPGLAELGRRKRGCRLDSSTRHLLFLLNFHRFSSFAICL